MNKKGLKGAVKIIFFLALLVVPLFFINYIIPSSASTFSTTILGFTINFLGVVDNSDGTYTWMYSVTSDDSRSTKALSHITFGLCVPAIDSVVDPEEGEDTYTTTRSPTSELITYDVEIVDPDPTTGVSGIKYEDATPDGLGEDGEVETDFFNFTLDGFFGMGGVDVEVGVKANIADTGWIAGPNCEITTTTTTTTTTESTTTESTTTTIPPTTTTMPPTTTTLPPTTTTTTTTTSTTSESTTTESTTTPPTTTTVCTTTQPTTTTVPITTTTICETTTQPATTTTPITTTTTPVTTTICTTTMPVTTLPPTTTTTIPVTTLPTTTTTICTTTMPVTTQPTTTTVPISTTTICEIPDPPVKTVGDPKIECEVGDWCDWKITMSTPITLSCENTQVKWRYALDGDWKEWHTDESPVTIYFPEESNHTLEVKCVNNCGESSTDSENFKVEGTKFTILLKKKWNLISVPFVLLNDDPDEVFKDIKDDIDSVWTYDGETDEWYIYTANGEPDTLNHIIPGWGYWVMAKDDTMLVIGGSLFSPATTPPSKNLVKGWNLIGYYGTGWQEYLDGYDSCGDYYEFGNYAYCALNSLVDTQEGYPRWGSLLGYDNCGEHDTDWVTLDLCDNMYAGKGYWIEIDVEDGYAPATVCLDYCD